MRKLFCLSFIIAVSTLTSAAQSRPSRPSLPSMPSMQEVQRRPVASKIEIGTGNFWFYTINSPVAFRFRGQFAVADQRDIDMYVVDQESFENFVNRDDFLTFYSSGRKTIRSFDVQLDRGFYYVILSSRHSTWIGRTVFLTIY